MATASSSAASLGATPAERDLQPFFVLHKASTGRKDRTSNGQGKLRKRNEPSSSSPKSGKKLEGSTAEGGDRLLFEQQKIEAFDIVWAKIESTIKDVLRDQNASVFNNIQQWVLECFNATRLLGEPSIAEATRSFPVLNNTTPGQLFTALVITRNMEFVDDILTFEELSHCLKSHGCHVAMLSSLEFSLKNGIAGCLKALLREFLGCAIDTADISILASWYREQDSYNKPLVLIINDLERCCGSVLTDFILMLSEWVVKVPIILIFGVATTVDAPRNILPSHALDHLCLSKFMLGAPAERMDAIVEAVLVKHCTTFNIGYKVALFLRNYFINQDGTVTSFIRALKVACLLHFSMEPLSLIHGKILAEDQKEGKSAFLPETMLKYMDELPSYARNQIDDQTKESMAKGLSELVTMQKLWSTVVLCLYEAGKYSKVQLLDLLCEALNKDLYPLRDSSCHGQIPAGLANVSTLSAFNVSFNNLSGSLPSNSSLIKCSSAVGNPFLRSCIGVSLTVPSADQHGVADYPNSYTAAPPEDTGKTSGNGFTSIEIACITSASAIVSVLLALIVLFVCTRKWNPRSRVVGSTRKEVTVFTDVGFPLTFESVVRATGNFNAGNCIGNGGFGATYKAEISPGNLVAIKRLSVGRFQGAQQFHAEIKTLGRLHHPNLVTLIGYHASDSEMFLIYNYLSGGNLEKFIQERSTRAVDWRILHKIALDIARALAYLHDQCVPRVLHRDVKPSNILLDDDYNAYLSDFGLARLLGTSETHATTGVAGTFGYVAPEYAMTCRVSDKADVYSYGVVLLELLSDKKALDPSFSSYGNGFNIVAWACMLLRQGQAKDFFTAGLWDAAPADDLVEVLHLAVVCTVETLSTRPTMKQVVRRLKQLQPPSC